MNTELLQEAQSAAAILQLSIAPVTVISGVGLLLLSMTNRYARVVDRTRILLNEIKKTQEEQAISALAEQMQIMYGRAKLIRMVILLCTTCIVGVVISIFCIFATRVFNLHLEQVAIGSFMVGLLALIVSLVLFLKDLAVSLKVLHIEAEKYLKN